MDVYKDLEVILNGREPDEYAAAIEKSLSGGWSRDKATEENSIGMLEKPFYYFVCERAENREPALVSLVERDPGILYVSNVVPRETGHLDHAEYNSILDDFFLRLAKPAAEEIGALVSVSSGQEGLDDWVCRDTADKLRAFSAAANKSTGSSHPSDRNRWFAFLASVIRNKDELDASFLERWLIEEEGWPEETAFDLAIEFEFGIGLLNHYLGR